MSTWAPVEVVKDVSPFYPVIFNAHQVLDVATAMDLTFV
jgi:hypothetical protein